MSGLEQRILVSINFERKRMEEFVDYVLREYCNVQVWIKIGWNNQQCTNSTVWLDGFQIKKTEDISILHTDDIVYIYYFPSLSERNSEVSKPSESVQRKSCESELETGDVCTPVPTIIDHSNNQSEAGYIIPTNKIIRFTKDDNDEIDALPMRVAPAVSYHGENTNTPTVNVRPSKKRTRRGKRAGKKAKVEALRFLDFVSTEAPTIMSSTPVALNEPNLNCNETPLPQNEQIASSNDTNSSFPQMISPNIDPNNTPVEMAPANNDPNPASNSLVDSTTTTTTAAATAAPIDSAKQEDHRAADSLEKTECSADSTVPTAAEIENPGYTPCIQDIIRYQTPVLDPESRCPVMKEVEGRVLK